MYVYVYCNNTSYVSLNFSFDEHVNEVDND